MNAELPMWKLRNRTLLPIVQGGMGVGISAHRLAGNVARLGSTGTLSSVDLRTGLGLTGTATDNQVIQELLNRGKLVVDN